jgi:hypothetical protein
LQFEFVVADILSLEPIVKCMHIVSFGAGVNLQEQAELKASHGGDPRTIARLRTLASEAFSGAELMMPIHQETIIRAREVRLQNEVIDSKQTVVQCCTHA